MEHKTLLVTFGVVMVMTYAAPQAGDMSETDGKVPFAMPPSGPVRDTSRTDGKVPFAGLPSGLVGDTSRTDGKVPKNI
jgi:hypothetical protein